MNNKQIALIAALGVVAVTSIAARVYRKRAINKAVALTAEKVMTPANTMSAEKELAQIKFNEVYANCELQVVYNPEWCDKQGRLSDVPDGAYRVELPEGQIASSICPNGRRILFVGTRFKTVAIWQDSAAENGVFDFVYSKEIFDINIPGMFGAVDEVMYILLGDKGLERLNIGEWLENMYAVGAAK